MTKVQKFLKSLPDPDVVCQSEYRAIHEVLTDSAPESLELVESILLTFIGEAEHLLASIGRRPRPDCQTVLLELQQGYNKYGAVSENRVLRKVRAEHPEFVQVVSLVAGVVDEKDATPEERRQVKSVQALITAQESKEDGR